MIFAVVVRLNNAPNLAASHHRTSPCRFDIEPAYDDTHKPLMLNLIRANLMKANSVGASDAATGHALVERHQRIGTGR